MSPSLESRIAALARRDRILAITFTVLMWLVLVPLCMAAASVAPTTGITVALVVSMLLLALFNTASTLAMLRRYALNRDEIYRPDIVNADLARQHAQQGRR